MPARRVPIASRTWWPSRRRRHEYLCPTEGGYADHGRGVAGVRRVLPRLPVAFHVFLEHRGSSEIVGRRASHLRILNAFAPMQPHVPSCYLTLSVGVCPAFCALRRWRRRACRAVAG